MFLNPNTTKHSYLLFSGILIYRSSRPEPSRNEDTIDSMLRLVRRGTPGSAEGLPVFGLTGRSDRNGLSSSMTRDVRARGDSLSARVRQLNVSLLLQ